MSTTALTRCMLASRTQEGAAQAPCQRTLPRPTRRAKLPTHACIRARFARANLPNQRLIEQDASLSATSTEATLHATVCGLDVVCTADHSEKQCAARPISHRANAPLSNYYCPSRPTEYQLRDGRAPVDAWPERAHEHAAASARARRLSRCDRDAWHPRAQLLWRHRGLQQSGRCAPCAPRHQRLAFGT